MTVNQMLRALMDLGQQRRELPIEHVCAYCRKASSSDLFEVKDGRVELHDEPTTRFIGRSGSGNSSDSHRDTT